MEGCTQKYLGDKETENKNFRREKAAPFILVMMQQTKSAILYTFTWGQVPLNSI